MTRAASAVAFRVLLVAIAAAVVYFDMTLALARTTRPLAVKAADCSASPVAAPARDPTPASAAAPTGTPAAPSVPPGFVAAFGSCGETAAPSRKDR